MAQWHLIIQNLIDEIDRSIRDIPEGDISLERMAGLAGCSPTHLSRRFRAISGMGFREYVRARKLAFALKDLRDSDAGILDVAVKYGFSSHEAFTRAFRALYGMTPSEYRAHPVPLAIRTILRPFDCYIARRGGEQRTPAGEVRTYFVTVPAHKFLHVKNLTSIGYFDFWEKQSKIPGQDCETVCGILESIPGKLDDMGGSGIDSGAGQIMAFLNDPAGRICSWGIPLAECYGARLPLDYSGPVPDGMLLTDVPEGEYLVFEHGPFDYATENAAVEAKIERAMAEYDYAANGCELDLTPGRIFYFHHDCTRYWKYIRPIRRI